MKALTYNGIQVIEHPLLPVDECVDASNIETKQPVKISTQNKIHCFKHGDVLFVSGEIFNKIKQTT